MITPNATQEGAGRMTLAQLKYVVTVAKAGTMTEAAKELFISQPSLTKSIKELEKEMHVRIFDRTNKGIVVSKDGEEFLAYARQVLEQAELLEEKYMNKSARKQEFCVSTQHYSFAVNAFVDLIKEYGNEKYDFSLRETQTYELIEDVASLKSEIGSPLAGRKSVTMEELKPYPYLSFEQGEHNAFYFSEEIFSMVERPKNIRVRDRATLFNLLIGLNGYTVCSGVIDEDLNSSDIVAVPLDEEGEMEIGILLHKKFHPSKLGDAYLKALRKYATNPLSP